MARPKYSSAKELETQIKDYYEWAESQEKPLTFSGLAYHLGFSSRQSIWEYANRKDELSLPIKRAMLKIESDYEEALRTKSCTGAIFALKNRGWSDKQEIEHSTTDEDGNKTGISFK